MTSRPAWSSQAWPVSVESSNFPDVPASLRSAAVYASRQRFQDAIAPVLADLERQHPGLMRVEMGGGGEDPQAMLWDSDGSGTGVWLSDSFDRVDAVVYLADCVQEAAIEAVWGVTGRGVWPQCPEHPDAAPLAPVRFTQSPWWCCPTDGRMVAPIGELPA